MKAGKEIIELLVSKVGAELGDFTLEFGDAVFSVNRDRLKDSLRLLKLDADLRFDLLVDITVVDWLDSKQERFQIIYNLLSLKSLSRLRVQAWVSEEAPEVESVTDLWAGANFLEREVWDMYGIKFKGHPDLRRILMYEEFVGFPLRKDYPVQGKQPRVPLIAPEVRNTAVDMSRPELVQIGKRKEAN